MKLSELFPQRRVLSFEVFPPKRTSPIGTVYHALSALQGLNPDVISVTYGASGGAGTKMCIRDSGNGVIFGDVAGNAPQTVNIAGQVKPCLLYTSTAPCPHPFGPV